MSAIEALREAAGDAIVCDGGDNGYPTLHGQTTLVIDPARAREVFDAAKAAGFDHLAQLTAVDWIDGLPAPATEDGEAAAPPENGEPRFQVTYNLYSYEAAERLSLLAFVPRDDPRIPSAANTWRAADWHERECYDMFGVVFEDHPNLTRIFMPDEWEGHPHRKDYDVTKEQFIYREGIEDRVTTDPSKGW